MVEYNTFWGLIEKSRIIIPQLQRDYAQGRKTESVKDIRKEFLDVIFASIKSENPEPIELDFIYGNCMKSTVASDDSPEQTFFPLDGQQRLTTLFLLHCFAAIEAKKPVEETGHLNRFGYETRHSSRVFCGELVRNINNIKTDQPIDVFIKNQPWYMSSWIHDPTVASMLVMLHAIQDKASKLADNGEPIDWNEVWNNLISEKCPITFSKLQLDDFNLSDELYIKMNARGKQLTKFEIFKSKFMKILPTKELQNTFSRRADSEWSKLFWEMSKEIKSEDKAKHADEAFLRCFKYITNILRTQAEIEDNKELFELYGEIYKSEENVHFLFDVLDFFHDVVITRSDYFESLFYKFPDDYASGKVRIFNSDIDLIRSCSHKYQPGRQSNPFTLSEQLMLYAIILNELDNTDEFRQRLRQLRNLLENSTDRVRNENYFNLLESTRELITTGDIKDDFRLNQHQIKQERLKMTFLTDNPSLSDAVFKLEDNYLLRGAIGIIDLNPDTLVDDSAAFIGVFTDDLRSQDYDQISCALMSINDYSQKLNQRRKQYGAGSMKSWNDLFTESQDRIGMGETRLILQQLLRKVKDDPKTELKKIQEDYISNCNERFPWNRYYIQYKEMRFLPEEYGDNGVYGDINPTKPYEFVKMNKSYYNGHHWNPFLLTALKKKRSKYLSMGDYNEPLVFNYDGAAINIRNRNNGYILTSRNEDGERLIKEACDNGFIEMDSDENGRLYIDQSDEGVDNENRVERLLELLENLESMRE